MSDNRAANLCCGLYSRCFCLHSQWHGVINVLAGDVGEEWNMVKHLINCKCLLFLDDKHKLHTCSDTIQEGQMGNYKMGGGTV